jgi:hypothetical protein
MRRVWAGAVVLAGVVGLGGSAQGQMLADGTFAGPSFGWFAQPGGLYTSVGVPGMGRSGPSVMMYVPANGSGPSVAGLQARVPGTTGSVYLPGPTAGAPTPLAIVAGGGLGLPAPRPPASTTARARPAASKKAAAQPRAVAKADAPRAPEPDAQAEAKGDGKSTLRARRGIR